MNVDDPYSELGLAPDSTDAEVKAAWRRLAARWHPDRNKSPQALRKIQRINRALEEIRRSRGALALAAEEPEEEKEEEEEPPAEPAVEHAVTITLEEAALGCSRELEGELAEPCHACAGHGLEVQPTQCGECRGTGQVRPHLWFGWMTSNVECAACQGRGKVRHRCTACAGSGAAPPRRYRCRVEVAAGTRSGTLLEVSARVPGRHRKHKVAMLVRVELQPHPFFTLEEDGTVRCEMPVDGFAWTANRWIEVPTPRGLQQMRLRRGFFSYRIKGQGLPPEDADTAADCIVTVVPLFPDDFSSEQEAAIDRLVASNSGAPGTPVGERVGAWNGMVADWRQGRDGDG